MEKIKKTVYQRIMDAREAGKGLRLSKEDVWELSWDDAIETRAQFDDFVQNGNNPEDWGR